MKERRLDLRVENKERMQEVKRTAEVLFRLNHTPPFSEEYNALLRELFTGGLGEDCYVAAPIYMNIAKNIHIGNNVSINPYFKCMSAGEVFIDDYAQIAIGVSIITNNHDYYDRPVLIIKDVHIGKNAWIGANSVILPGVTIGENAVVGAGSVVTHDVAADTVVAGNPARVIKRLDGKRFRQE